MILENPNNLTNNSQISKTSVKKNYFYNAEKNETELDGFFAKLLSYPTVYEESTEHLY